jgi:hypothetical protein
MDANMANKSQSAICGVVIKEQTTATIALFLFVRRAKSIRMTNGICLR